MPVRVESKITTCRTTYCEYIDKIEIFYYLCISKAFECERCPIIIVNRQRLPHMKRLTTLLMALLLLVLMAGASEKYQFKTLPQNEELTSKMVNTMFQDSDGLVYIGTSSGLNVFDGYRICSFTHDAHDITSLHDNFVQDIQKATDGRLWIKAGGSYSIFDPATGKFETDLLVKFMKMGLTSYPGIVTIDGNDYWMFVNGQGIYRYSESTGLKELTGASGRLPASCITDIIVTLQGKEAYAVTDKGELLIINPGNMRVTSTAQVPGSSSRFNLNYTLYCDREGLIWVFSGDGLYAYDPARKRWISDFAGQSWPMTKPTAITQDRKGRLWVGYNKSGIAIIDKNGSIELVKSDETDDRSLTTNIVSSLMEDRTGTMWVGTQKKGALLYSDNLYKFDSHAVKDVNCIAQGNDGSIWIGTDADGIMHMDREFKPISAFRWKDAPEAVVSLLPMADGSLWAGTYDGGLISIKNGSMKTYTKADGLSSMNTWALLALPDKRIMIGTLGGGVQIFNPDDKDFKTYRESNSGLRSDYITSLSADENGNVYIGTSEGLAVFNTAKSKITSMNGTRSGSQTFSNLNINQVYVDSRGLVWVATRDGLDVYDPGKDAITRVPLGLSARHRFILGIAEDFSNTMWITAGGSLISVKMTDGEDKNDAPRFDITEYDSSDGLQHCDFNQRSLCVMSDGQIAAGGLYGVNAFHPENLKFNTYAPKVNFSHLYLYNQEVEPGKEYDGMVLLPKTLPNLKEIKLKKSQNEFAISFGTDDYIMPEKMRYIYRLEGFNSDWTELPEGHNRVSYTNLSAGTYTLHVKAVNSDGTPSAEESTLKIKILPPFYATIWAQIIYALLAIAVVIAIYRFIRRRERAIFLRKTKEERSKKIEELNQLKFKFFTNISHDLRTPLTLILSPVESMLKEDRNEKDIRRLTTVKTNATILMGLVNQLLDFRKNEMVGLKYHPSEGDIVATVKDVTDSFADIADRRHISLSFSTNIDSHETTFDNDKMRKMLMNLISNANKYTPDGGSIGVTVDYDGHDVRISVADSGNGVADNDKKHIFERFYRSSDQSDHISGTGIGLSLVKEYARLHGGNVQVYDNLPCGAVFTVSIPDHPAQVIDKDTAEGDKNAEQRQVESQSKSRILFVDDNKDMTDFLKEEFSTQYDVTTASDGKDAMKKIAKQSFDVIVSDIMMPNMNGIELCRALKANPETVDIPMILLTAKQDIGDVIEGLTLGADDYVTKPFNNEVLALRIKRLITLQKRGLKGTRIEPTPSEVRITSLDEQLVAKAVKYVEDNMARPDLSVEELSANLGMSRVHLYKKLVALTGKTPIEFIRVLRLKRAAQYLRESQLNVSEIAFKLGFNNPKYFSKYFKAEFGISPSEYQDKEGI